MFLAKMEIAIQGAFHDPFSFMNRDTSRKPKERHWRKKMGWHVAN